MASYDWDAIEREYRAGQLTIREISRQHGPAESTIRKRAKKCGWSRSLSAAVKKEVREGLVREDAGPDAREDAEIVREAAARGVEVVRQHRKQLARLSVIRDAMTSRLCEVIEGRAEGVEVTVKKRGGGEKRVVLSFLGPHESLSDALLKLSRTTSQLVSLERQAFNLDAEEASGSHETTLEDLE